VGVGGGGSGWGGGRGGGWAEWGGGGEVGGWGGGVTVTEPPLLNYLSVTATASLLFGINLVTIPASRVGTTVKISVFATCDKIMLAARR